MVPDPELPGHLLLEQYQAQLVSAIRTALDASSGPILLEAGLQLATKILTSGMISGDQIAVKRIFSLISRPLDEFKDLYYPSFAEWVSCKIKIRLLTAHASLKCYTYAFLRRQHSEIPDEYLALLPLFSKNASILGKYWISILKDFSYICFHYPKRNWNSFLDGIQSPLVSTKLQQCLEEAWPVVLQAVALDSVPVNYSSKESSQAIEDSTENSSFSGYSMVELESEDYLFLWGFALLILFQGQDSNTDKTIIPVGSVKSKFSTELNGEDPQSLSLKLYEIVLPVFQFLSAESFFRAGFLKIDLCRELLQVFSYSIFMDDTWDSLAISVLSQIVKNCPKEFIDTENYANLAAELCLAFLFKFFQSADDSSPHGPNWEEMISVPLTAAKILLMRLETKKQLQLVLPFLLIGYKCIGRSSTDSCFSKVNEFVHFITHLLKNHVEEKSKLDNDDICYLRKIIGASLDLVTNLGKDCIKNMHILDDKRLSSTKLLQTKLAISLEQLFSFTKLSYEFESMHNNQEHLYTIFTHCTSFIQTLLADPIIQVRAIGLQVIEGLIQKCSNSESNSFVIFFVSELLADILLIIQQMLKNPITKEGVTVAGECLRILTLLQTLSKDSESQKGLMNLLLEAIVLVFSTSNDTHSREVDELRSTSIRLVSLRTSKSHKT
jgi:hypothetical protein